MCKLYKKTLITNLQIVLYNFRRCCTDSQRNRNFLLLHIKSNTNILIRMILSLINSRCYIVMNHVIAMRVIVMKQIEHSFSLGLQYHIADKLRNQSRSSI